MIKFFLANDMECTQETDSSMLAIDIDKISIHDPVVDKSVVENESNNSELANTYENLFEKLKENKKQIFVLSTAGKPIYTR